MLISHPANTIIVSPDNASRRAINQAVWWELQLFGTLQTEDHPTRVLTPHSDMTGADRACAARYQTGGRSALHTRKQGALNVWSYAHHWTVTVTGTEGSIQHATTATLVVQ